MNCEIFWIALTAIGTLAMAGTTVWALCQNREQLNELKRQWEEQNRARLILTTKLVRNSILFVEVRNVGNNIASNINLHIDDDFIQKMVEYDFFLHEDLDKIKGGDQHIFELQPTASIKFTISDANGGNIYAILKKEVIKFTLNYNQRPKEIINIQVNQTEIIK